MAGWLERIKIIFDVDSSNATRGFKSLRADVAAADGALGKAKVGAQGIGQMLGQFAGPAALAAGGAIATFAAKSVMAFTDSALAAGEFSDATAISIEDASRWIAIGDDFGISAESIQGALMKVNKASESVFDKYGISVALAADGTRDANGTFLNALEAVGKMPDANERARAATELFGKSYGEISRLIEMDSASLVQALGDVSEAQVIDEEEEAKAKRLQAAMDALQEVVGDLAISVGETLTPALASAAESITAVSDALGPLLDMVDQSDAADGKSGLFDGWGEILDDVRWHFDNIRTGGNAATEGMGKFVSDGLIPSLEAAEDFTVAVDDSADSISQAAEEVYTLQDALKDAANEARDFAETQRELSGATRDWDDTLVDVGGATLEALTKQQEYKAALDEGTMSSEELAAAQGEMRAAYDDLDDASFDAVENAKNLAKATADASGAAEDGAIYQGIYKGELEKLRDTLAPGSPVRQYLQDYIDDLNSTPESINTTVSVNYLTTSNGQPGDFYVDENGNVRPKSAGIGGLSAMEAWYASVLGGTSGGASAPTRDPDAMRGTTDEEAKKAKALVDKAGREYERGTRTAKSYRRILRSVVPLFKPLSDYGMFLFRELERVDADIAEAMAAGDKPTPAADKPMPEAPDPWEVAANQQAAAEAQADLADAFGALTEGMTDDDPNNDKNVQEAWANAIYADIAARATVKYGGAQSPQWARWVRARLEQAIADNAGLPHTVARLRIFLRGLPRFPDDGPTGGGDGPGSNTGGRPTMGGKSGVGSGRMGGGSGHGGITVVVNQSGVLMSDGKAIRRAMDQAAPEIAAALRRFERGQG